MMVKAWRWKVGFSKRRIAATPFSESIWKYLPLTAETAVLKGSIIGYVHCTRWKPVFITLICQLFKSEDIGYSSVGLPVRTELSIFEELLPKQLCLCWARAEHWPWALVQTRDSYTKRQATQTHCLASLLASLLGDGDKWMEIMYGEEKNILYWAD